MSASCAADTGTPIERAPGLEGRIARELAAPAPPAAHALADAMRARHGAAVAGILFYGSCLRRDSAAGVLDFWLLVDGYRSVYGPRPAAAWNALLPPNVHYLECPPPAGPGRLRAKYAVISLGAFERLSGPRALHPYVWARFAQPARLLYARDESTRERVVQSCAQAFVTFVRRLVPYHAEPAGGVRASAGASAHGAGFSSEVFWQTSFPRTYATEFRSESPERVAELYTADAERYDALLWEALQRLQAEGSLERVERGAGGLRVHMNPARRRRALGRMALTRPLSKCLALLRLVKTPLTFDGWAPYALWKIERHTGTHIEPTPRQLRHPFLFGWPILFRLLRKRQLR